MPMLFVYFVPSWKMLPISMPFSRCSGFPQTGHLSPAFTFAISTNDLGVGRAIAAIAQESNDKAGLILPITVAPYKVHICPLRIDDQNVREKAFALYDALMKKGVNVLLDDRENVSNGVKFADADLMGMPIRVVVSPRGLQNDEIEVTDRATLSADKVKYEDALSYIDAMMARKYEELK